MNTEKELSEAEVWDDSALVDSWNEALAEYKHYHSLHVRGEKVEAVLDAAEDEKPIVYVKSLINDGIDGELIFPSGEDETMEGSGKESSHVNMEADGSSEFEALPQNKGPHPDTRAENHVQMPDAAKAGSDRVGPVPSFIAVPQALIGQGSDEALKNLMMSWYYAGYYTGLHEGQQQALQTQATPKPTTKD